MDAEVEWGIGRAVGGKPMYRPARMRVGTTWYSAQIVEVMRIVTHPAPPRSELHLLEYADETGAHAFTAIPYGDEAFAWAVQRFAHMVHVPPAAVDIEIAGQRIPVGADRLPPGDTAKFARAGLVPCGQYDERAPVWSWRSRDQAREQALCCWSQALLCPPVLGRRGRADRGDRSPSRHPPLRQHGRQLVLADQLAC